MQEPKDTPAEPNSDTRPYCPYCSSSDVVFKTKAACWECQSCEERFSEEATLGSPIRKLGDKAQHPKHIFFSYGHDANKELVLLFKADLENRGHTIWFDTKDIGTWDDWKASITRGIDSSEMALAFMSKHALRDPGVCRNEIALSLNRFGTIYPVAIEPEIYDDIPVTIRHLQWPDLSQWQAIRAGQVAGEDWARWYESHLVELIERIEGDATHFAGETQALRGVLRPASFEAKFAQHLQGFVGREWIFGAYEHWLNEEPESRLFWIKAGPGVGKTALAVNLAAHRRGAIVASWFCDAQSAQLRDPRQAIFSLAFQLALRIEDFRVRLLRQLGITGNSLEDHIDGVRKDLENLSPQDLFRTLMVEPLANLIWREHKLVIVIDALDEAADEEGRNPLVEFIANQLGSLPKWVAFVVTSRPDPAVITYLQSFKPLTINAQDARNLADLHAWYGQTLAKRPEIATLPHDEQQRLENLLIERSEGMILYLTQVEEAFKNGSLDVAGLDRLEKGLPGLFSQYQASFLHRFGSAYGRSEVKPLLRLLIAAGGPLPSALACEVLGWNAEEYQAARVDLGSYVIESPAGLHLFHKTLAEWLLGDTCGKFRLDPAPARQAIADALFRELHAKDSIALRWRDEACNWLPLWIGKLSQKEDPEALNELASLLNFDGHFDVAESLFRTALALCKAMRPADHLDIVIALNNLAELLWVKGSYGEAESLLREALEIRKTSLVRGAPALADCLHSLASVLESTCRYDEAELLFRDALKMFKDAHPRSDSDVSNCLCSLGQTLQNLGRFDEAEPLLREALEIRQAAQPPDPRDIATSRNNLALLLLKTGRHDEAEQHFREALGLFRATNPSGHPYIAGVLSNLASLLSQTGRLDESEALCREALEMQTSLLPPGHPDIARSLGNLAMVLQTAGRFDEAEPLLRQALEIRQAALQPGHPEIAVNLNNLAAFLFQTGRLDEAEPLLGKVLEIQKAVLEPDHPDIAMALNNLASLYQATGRYDEAETLFREALQLRRSSLPPNHPDIALGLNNLGVLLEKAGRYREAGLMFFDALDIYKDADASSNMLTCMLNVANLLKNIGEYEDAIEIYQTAIHVCENLAGAENSLAKQLQSNIELCRAMAAQKGRSEATTSTS